MFCGGGWRDKGGMFQFLKTLLRRPADATRDPLAHPAIARMTERERADLPFCPGRVEPE